ncbi:MAG: hypothetical protein GY828_05375 [Candidatus Gracilibacteria bacterium]|nr:hypothetical protein [Candidatus Gracilibacteria bacterium]
MTDSLRKEYNIVAKLKVWFGEKSVIVFTMGKVGTLTICNSLRSVGYKHVHPHSLCYTRPGIHFVKVKLSFLNNIKYTIKTFLKRLKVWVWKKLNNEILIISGVRDPFSRNISAFFEQVHYLGGISNVATSKEIIAFFEASCEFDAPLNWFDKEVLKVTGINVYNYPFDKEKGFVIINKGKFRLLIFRIDKLNKLSNEISEFIDEKKFSIISTNLSKHGDYPTQLNNLKKTYKYDVELSQRYKHSKYFQHFYTSEERKDFVERWSK